MLKALIVVPTYNEIDNITAFIRQVFQVTNRENIDADILVVDDNSPDGTAAAAAGLIPEYPEHLYLLNRPEKQGLGAAYIAGFQWGIPRGYGYFLEIDADFSHNPEYIPEMFKKIQTYDVVIGSRYVKSGGVKDWPLMRKCISMGGSLYSRIVLGCPIKDLTGGFNLWKRTALEKIGLDTIVSKGFSFQLEMKFKAFLSGCGIAEIPIVFVDRKMGNSKMSGKIFFEALLNVWKIKKKSGAENILDQFIKFFITGGLGTITNLVLFFLCADLANLRVIPVSIGCFLAGGTQNYFLNHLWSFKKETAGTPPSIIKWGQYISASLIGLAVNIFVMQTMLAFFALPFKFIAQAFGIAAGMCFNFVVSKLIVFRDRPKTGRN